jgi:hypothetical protein
MARLASFEECTRITFMAIAEVNNTENSPVVAAGSSINRMFKLNEKKNRSIRFRFVRLRFVWKRESRPISWQLWTLPLPFCFLFYSLCYELALHDGSKPARCRWLLNAWSCIIPQSCSPQTSGRLDLLGRLHVSKITTTRNVQRRRAVYSAMSRMPFILSLTSTGNDRPAALLHASLIFFLVHIYICVIFIFGSWLARRENVNHPWRTRSDPRFCAMEYKQRSNASYRRPVA